MESQIVEIDATDWRGLHADTAWTAALEAGKVLFFPRLGFDLQAQERPLLRPPPGWRVPDRWSRSRRSPP